MVRILTADDLLLSGNDDCDCDSGCDCDSCAEFFPLILLLRLCDVMRSRVGEGERDELILFALLNDFILLT